MPDVKFPKAVSGPQLPDKSVNPFWPLIVTARNWGIKPLEADSNGNVWLKNITDQELFGIDTLEDLVTAGMGIEVYHYPLYLAVDSTQIDPSDETPEAFTQAEVFVPAVYEQVLVSPAVVEDGITIEPPVYEQGDLVSEATTRRKRWSELVGFKEVDGVFYVAAGNGRQYQPASEVFAFAARPADPAKIDFSVNPIAVVALSEVPTPEEEVL